MQNQSPGVGVAGIQTDAICAVCGNVNPEGTMQCVSCGNNLAEQHRQRLAQGGHQVFEDSVVTVRMMMSGAITVLGLLLVLFVALNLGRIENLMVEAQTTSGPVRLWNGKEAALYIDLFSQLAASLPSEEEVNAVLETPLPVTDIAGRYVLVTGTEAPIRAGSAVLRRDGDMVYFVARVNQGGEVRGKFMMPAGAPSKNITVRWEDTGLQYQGAIYGCAGAAILHEDGAIECFGQTELDTNDYLFTAYKLP